MRTMFTIAAGLVVVAGPAFAQSAKDNYSYSAPSGMFSEGTTKWQMFRYMAEDAENRARVGGGQPTATGSIQGSATGTEQVRRPGESGARRPTAR